MKKTLLTTLSLFAVFATAMAQTDLNKPFGWTNCTSLTSGDDYTTKGGNAVASPKTVTLKATGGDDKNNIANAIKSNQIIILDGTNGDFTVSRRHERHEQQDHRRHQRREDMHEVLSHRGDETRT